MINCSLNRSQCKGFSFLELLLVIVIIAVLIALGFRNYANQIDKSKIETLRFQAATFMRMVQHVHAYGVSTGANSVYLVDKTIYLNEYGYPANTSAEVSSLSRDQTDHGCAEIWRAFFSTIKQTKENKKPADMNIRSIENRFCRYDLRPDQTGSYFFDYYFKTGNVLIAPQLEN